MGLLYEDILAMTCHKTTLTPAESVFLKVLLDAGGATTAEVQKALSWRGRNRTRRYIRKVLSTLEKKGYVTRRLQGQEYICEARVPRGSAFDWMVSDMVKDFIRSEDDEYHWWDRC
jgi:predicted transcriptional regulator